MLAKLSNREKYLLIACAIIVLIFFIQVLVTFNSNLVDTPNSDESLSTLRNNLIKMRNIEQNWPLTSANRDNAQDNLSNFIEDFAKRINKRSQLELNRIQKANGSLSQSVQIKLSDVNLGELLEFVYLIENSPHNINIAFLKINTSISSNNLNLTANLSK